jgi:phosphopantothenoylcysteine decarboxylase/phosphopantothenate--cysteine ligase
MTDIHQIVDEVNAFFARKKKLLGKKIVITAGSTEESLDAVRIITNRASGKSGVFLAEEAYQLGADVTLIRGSHAVAPSLPVTDIVVKSSQDMKEALEKSLLDADVVIHTAAVADFYLPDPLKDKVKSSKQWNLTLVPTKKIVTTIKQINPHVFLVAYKAENGLSEPELIESANLLLKQTHADIVVANDIGRHDAGFGVDDNDVWIVTETSVKHVPFMHKRLLAQRLLDFIGNQFDIKSKQC